MASLLDGCTPWPEEFVDHYWAAGHWQGNTLDNLLRGWALRYGPRTALVHDGTRLTYAQLNRRADRMAAGFRGRGLRPGMRVVLQLPNVPEFVVTAFALMRAGLVPVFCPLSSREPEVAGVVRTAQAVGYVGPSTHQGFDHTAMAARIAARWPFLRRVFTYETPGSESPYGGLTTDPSNCQYAPLGSLDAPPEPALPQSAGQVAFLLVSGTGVLVPRTHDDFAHQATAAARSVALGEDDVYLAALPAEADLALGAPGVIGALSAGATVVLADATDPAAWFAALAREGVTVTALTPDTARRRLDALPATGPAPSALRLAQIAGTPPDRTVAERIGTALDCRVQQVFGTPEGLLTLTRPADPDDAVLATHGRPLSPDDQIRLVDDGGDPVPDGTPGELLARGPHTIRGYYRAPDHDARAFTPDGYLRTGHLAHRTPDGDLVVTGRCDDAA
ncbi:AMP-binding protein [Streptomyces racemochromogenes]|uniref:AMP-binding protein n=1 Tax=Streptomyces racemochromogenes TaxID=67353 RepID=A0ABW7PAX2_9ACTN